MFARCVWIWLIGASSGLCACGKVIGLTDVPASSGDASSAGASGSTTNCADATQGGACQVCKIDPLCSSVGSVCVDKSTVVNCAQDSQGCFYHTAPYSCVGAKTVCSGGSCYECTPGATRCDYHHAANSVQTCNANGTWSPQVVPCDAATPSCLDPDPGGDHNDRGICKQPLSCAEGGPGLSNCGTNIESCCTSLLVVGGSFYRTYKPNSVIDLNTMAAGAGGESDVSDLEDPATVSSFRMDKYKVTVGRFRQFARAWTGGPSAQAFRPSVGSGVHSHVHDGKGLLDNSEVASDAGVPPSATYEPGWQDAYSQQVHVTDDVLGKCDASTWTSEAGAHENLPINCINWFEAFAFCAWDHGFLETEAEWEYAAAGGSQQREYPWGSTDPGTKNEYAIYNCNWFPTMTPGCATVAYIAPVGSASLGQGLWGQLDLVGEVWEFTLDWFVDPYPGHAAYKPGDVTGCVDCAPTSLSSPNMLRTLRGGNFRYPMDRLWPAYRGTGDPTLRFAGWGARCARPP